MEEQRTRLCPEKDSGKSHQRTRGEKKYKYTIKHRANRGKQTGNLCFLCGSTRQHQQACQPQWKQRQILAFINAQ